MPSVSYNGQCFLLDGRRLWILAASIQYARIPPELWPERIAAARQAGFNTIETACPWLLHEPRKGRYAFTDGADVKRFVELCDEANMRVILRAGPFVGCGFDGGGLPNWLMEDPLIALREASEPFLERVTRYFRKLFGELDGLQAAKDGPITLVQVEHDWTCANDDQAERYLREIGRVIRECGVAVPLINANNLWLDSVGTIDTWSGDDDLLVNLRQLRTVQPGAPRIVRMISTSAQTSWGDAAEPPPPPTMLRHLAEVLAAGAQPIVDPFHGGTNFGFLGGRLPGDGGSCVTTSAAASPPLGEAGARGESYAQVRRIVTFANEFGHVFSDLDPDYQPVALDPGTVGVGAGAGAGTRSASSARGTGRKAGCAAISLVPLRGAGGRIVFVFGDGAARTATLLLDDGLRLPIDLGDQSVGWYVRNADLHGRGRLDYANLCPFAIIDRRLIVLHGPAGTVGYISISGTPLEVTVPKGAKPLVVEHKDVHLVICNRKQIDATYHDDDRVCVGIAGFDTDGRPLRAEGWPKAWSIDSDGVVETLSIDDGAGASKGASKGGAKTSASATRRAPRSIGLKDWHCASAEVYAAGTSPRYASLSGPQTLSACGAPYGYGWYRMRLKSTSTKKRLVHAPRSGDRLHVFLDGAPAGVIGDGPGAASGPWEMSLAKGDLTITALVDNLGRFAGGNDLVRQVGLFGHLYEVKPMRAVKPKSVRAEAVDPFTVRAFILGASRGQPSDTEQVQWSFSHSKKTPILVDVDGARCEGTFVLNDEPIAYYAGAGGAVGQRLLLEPSQGRPFKRGKNVLRFAPNIGQAGVAKDIGSHTTLYECTEALTESADWSFAKWEPPPSSSFAPRTAPQAVKAKGRPAWWRSRFDAPKHDEPLWFDTNGLSKGQLYLNGRNVGRYFTATSTGRAVGPQKRLYVPGAWLSDGESNEILVFDEHGFAPHKTKIVASETGDLD